jgi:hypothetical protein
MSATPKLPQAEYRRLGNSGLRVSVPILGCMSFGSKKVMPYALEEEEVSSLRVLLRLIWCLLAFSGASHTEGRMGPRRHHMGHGQRLFEW